MTLEAERIADLALERAVKEERLHSFGVIR